MKPFLKFGLLTGLLVGSWNITCFTIVNWINNHFSLGIPSARIRALSGLFGITILIIGICLGMKAAKRKNGGILTYKQAITTGIGLSLVTAFITATFAFLYCTVINPGYTDYVVQDASKALQASHLSPEKIQAQLEQVRKEFSTSSQVLQSLIGQSAVGSLSSLIIGLFFRSKK